MKSFTLIAVALAALFLLVISPIVAKHVAAFCKDVKDAFTAPAPRFGLNPKQAGFVTLLRPYAGYQAGQTVELPASTEAALIASGGGVTSAGPATAGALSCSQTQGAATIAAGASSVVITNPLVTPQSIIFAVVAQAAADGTLLRVERVVAAAGSFTVYGTANATANTAIDWAIIGSTGVASNPG